jgi:hypothetical protein
VKNATISHCVNFQSPLEFLGSIELGISKKQLANDFRDDSKEVEGHNVENDEFNDKRSNLREE